MMKYYSIIGSQHIKSSQVFTEDKKGLDWMTTLDMA